MIAGTVRANLTVRRVTAPGDLLFVALWVHKSQVTAFAPLPLLSAGAKANARTYGALSSSVEVAYT